MTRRPCTALAHLDGLDLFAARDLAVLRTTADLVDPDPLGSWDDPRAETLLPTLEVIVGHWGCPLVDRALLERAPELGLVAYTAGSVKGVVEPEVLDLIRVTSGAVANAEPVAEYTLAMILLANKGVLWPPGADIASATPIGNWDKTIGIVGASLVGVGCSSC